MFGAMPLQPKTKAEVHIISVEIEDPSLPDAPCVQHTMPVEQAQEIITAGLALYRAVGAYEQPEAIEEAHKMMGEKLKISGIFTALSAPPEEE